MKLPQSIKRLIKPRAKTDKLGIGDSLIATAWDHTGRVKQHLSTDNAPVVRTGLHAGTKINVAISSTASDDDQLLHKLFSAVRKRKK